jgi:MFS transporter, ACS family, glucarate transporter
MKPETTTARPSKVRWQVIAMLAFIAALTYLDRLNLSSAGKYIQDEFSFSTRAMGWILSSFVLGYALFQVPCGRLGDRFGPRRLIAFAILWWSVFTAATAMAADLPLARWFGVAGSFIILRILIGVGEAAVFPNGNKVIALWIDAGHRGLANSLVFAGIGAGGVITPIFIADAMQRWGWRPTFYICGAVGVIVALGWFLFFRDQPEQHPRVNAAELNLIVQSRTAGASRAALPDPASQHCPWKKILRSPTVWSLLASYFCIGYPAYIFYTWFFIYLVQVRGLTITQGGLWTSTPFLAITVLSPLGGWFSDRAVREFGRRRGRQVAMWTGVAFSASFMWIGSATKDNTIAIILLALASGFNLFVTANLWATCNDLTRDFAGSLSGLMNMFGNLGGWLSPILTAIIATRYGWNQALHFAAVLTAIGGALWLFVNADQTFDEAA